MTDVLLQKYQRYTANAQHFLLVTFATDLQMRLNTDSGCSNAAKYYLKPFQTSLLRATNREHVLRVILQSRMNEIERRREKLVYVKYSMVTSSKNRMNA